MLQRHLQETYEYLFDAAHRALLEGASFAPFGAAIRKTGQQIHTKVDLPIERSAPSDHIRLLIDGFRQDETENGLIAAGLAFDGRARSDDTAALCFHLEAANGSAVEVIVPYTRVQSLVSFAEPQITPVQPEIFTDVQ